MNNQIAMSLSQQRLDIDRRISDLERLKNDLNYKIQVLKNGFNALGDGEDIFEGRSILAQEVRAIMCEKL